MVTDPIANYLTSLRNAIKAKHVSLYVPFSNLKKEITHILKDQGYILDYVIEKSPAPQGRIKINLKYHPYTKQPAILRLKRVSKPGLRQYRNATDIPHILRGLGIAILSTSQGVVTDKEARKKNVGGEVLCYVY